MAIISQKELRNNVAEVLRRTEAGEEFTITVSGRPVAELSPTRKQWVDTSTLRDLWALPPDPTLMRDLEEFGGGGFQDPWEDLIEWPENGVG